MRLASALSLFLSLNCAFGATGGPVTAKACEAFLLRSGARTISNEVRSWLVRAGELPMSVEKRRLPGEGAGAQTQFSRLDRLALGMDPEGTVQGWEMGPFTMSADPHGLRFHGALVNFELANSPLHVGYYSHFPSYNANAYGRRTPDDFMRRHGFALFEREVSGVRFGYGFDLEAMKEDVRIPIFEIRVYIVWDCDTKVTSAWQVLFPRPGRPRGSVNLCLTDIGVSLKSFGPEKHAPRTSKP